MPIIVTEVRTASDVGGTVLQIQKTENTSDILWSWNNGVWSWSRLIGAQIGCPDKQVINIAGDGCFRMNMNEIATAVRQKITSHRSDY